MSAKPVRHRVTVRKRRLYGSRMWWVTCTCGYFQGWHHKQDAERSGSDHLEKVTP